MNKKLVALAVAGAFALPLAAQAQTANVTLYGRLNGDLEFIRGQQADGSNPTVNRFSSNSSRLGVRGVESLGGGLNAIFQIESNVSFDTGNSSGSGLASRETFVGLQGNWGTFQAGKFLTPYDDIHPIFGNAATLNSSIFSTAAIWGGTSLAKDQGSFDARLGNSLRFNSANYSGFVGEIQYSTRDSSGFNGAAAGVNGGDNGDHTSELHHANVVSIGGFYNNGPINAGAVFERNNKVRNYTAFAGSPGCSATSPCFVDDYAWTVAGAYDFGTIMGGFGLRLSGVYEKKHFDTPGGDIETDLWGVGATVPLGGGRLYGFYGHVSNGKGGAPDGTAIAATGGTVKGPDTSAQQFELTYSYNLSKRTMVYGGYTQISNKSNARWTFGINPYAIAPGGDPKAIALGMVHFF